MDVVRSVVSTNDVILNRSCRDMGVGAFYVKVREAQHRWPNKPSISGPVNLESLEPMIYRSIRFLAHMDSTKNKYVKVSLVVVLARDFQKEKKSWTKEEVENYKEYNFNYKLRVLDINSNTRDINLVKEARNSIFLDDLGFKYKLGF
uniref:Uncharacterized protein n=1 Tax=Cucumis melo TaxID=3656 RepID=A0A9I9EEK1_CUCME